MSLGELSLVAGGWSCYLSPGRDLDGYFAVIVMTFFILNESTFDFWGKRVGGDGDFFDFDRDPDKSLQ